MSEAVDYSVVAEGFKDGREAQEFVRLCEAHWNDCDAVVEKGLKVEVFQDNGWRGGGLSCEDILRGAFGEWLKEHGHVRATFRCRYPERPRGRAGQWHGGCGRPRARGR